MEQKNITFKGLSRVASDVGIIDGVCSESVNVILEENELMPVIPPELVDGFPVGVDYEIVYNHKTNNYSHYIGILNNQLIWINENTTATSQGFYSLTSELLSIRGIGNILIVTTVDDMVYVMFDANLGLYKLLGSQIPEPIVDIIQENKSLIQDTISLNLESILKEVDPSFSLSDANNPLQEVRLGTSQFDLKYEGEAGYSALSDRQKTINRAYSLIADNIWGKISVKYSDIYSRNGIPQPVFLRYALRLYDGSYTRHSVPILISPTDFYWTTIIDNIKLTTVDGDDYGSLYAYNNNVSAIMRYCTLSVKIVNGSELQQWKDIIQGIDFFFSEPIYLTEFGSKIRNVSRVSSVYPYQAEYTLDQYEDDSYELELIEKSSFYEIKRIDLSELESNTTFEFDEISKKFGDVLPNLPKLPDGYNSNHELKGDFLYDYNKRLNMSNVKQYLCDGLCNVGSKITDTEDRWQGNSYTLIYHIKTDSGTFKTRSDLFLNSTDTADTITATLGNWLSYPDARCVKIEIYREQSGVIYKGVREMKSHPFLNVSYYYGSGGYDDEVVSAYPATMYNAIELIENKLYQSEVNNPFVFKASGIHSIPVGKILSIATTTTPISQGQFGQYPLYVFTDDGIWSMDVDSSGAYKNIVPFSRDICNNPKSVTPLDNLIVFSSDRGLMAVQGGNVVCISNDLKGKTLRLDDEENSLPYLEEVMAREGVFLASDISENIPFLDYINSCTISYDYANERLIVINEDCEYQYVYSLVNKTWHKLYLGTKFVRAFNNYPECFIQAEDGLMYNFSAIDDIGSYTEKVSALIVTRAMTLDQPFIRKRIDDLRVRGDFDKGSVVRLLYGSYDGLHWTFIRSLKGSSYKYFKIALLMKMLPKQRLNSVDILYTPRWNNKLR